MIQERTIQARPGIPVLLLGLPALLAVAILFFVGAAIVSSVLLVHNRKA